MQGSDAILLAQSALILFMTIAGPMLIASLVVGLVIGLLQALTQVQEMTLTFVPKLLVLGIVLLLSLPMIGQSLDAFMAQLSDKIIAG